MNVNRLIKLAKKLSRKDKDLLLQSLKEKRKIPETFRNLDEVMERVKKLW
jgi:hypothetical protein